MKHNCIAGAERPATNRNKAVITRIFYTPRCRGENGRPCCRGENGGESRGIYYGTEH